MGFSDRLKKAIIIGSSVVVAHTGAAVEQHENKTDLKESVPTELRATKIDAKQTSSQLGQVSHLTKETLTPESLIKALNALPYEDPKKLNNYTIPKERVVKHFTSGTAKSHHTVSRVSYQLLGSPLSLARQLDAEGMTKLITERRNGKPVFNYKGKNYTTRLPLSAEKQMELFGNTNEEIMTPIDAKSKEYLKSLAEATANKNSTLTYQETLDKMYQLHRMCGCPKIRTHQDEGDMIGAIIQSMKGQKVSHFNPVSNTIYINNQQDVADYCAEISHAFRNKNNTLNEGFYFIADGIKDMFSFNNGGFTQKAQEQNYRDKGKMEFDAHKNVEPQIKMFITSSMTPFRFYMGVGFNRVINGSAKEYNGLNASGIGKADTDKMLALAKKLDNENLLSAQEQRDFGISNIPQIKQETASFQFQGKRNGGR